MASRVTLSFENADAPDLITLRRMFVGRVRDRSHGRAVAAISYDVFDAMALAGFHEIARAAQEEFSADPKIHIQHAKGRLDVGASAVFVAVGSSHRDETFPRAPQRDRGDQKLQSDLEAGTLSRRRQPMERGRHVVRNAAMNDKST